MNITLIKSPVTFLLKKYSFLVLLICSPLGSSAAQNYDLVWSDEFDSTAVDLSKWEFQIGNGQGGWGNNERQYYRAENATVENGLLTITAKKENFNGYSYTSTRMRSIRKGDWTYGKMEIKAKMPVGKGIWPAIWMMPTDDVYGGWAASGEIDIMEYLGHDTKRVYGTLHYGGAWPNNKYSGSSYALSSGRFDEDFHVFTLIWEEGKFQWFVDSVRYLTQTSWYTTGHTFPAPFDQRFHMILNCAVGGNWPGYPDTTTTFPQEFIIDYVRVYQESATSVQQDNNYVPGEFELEQNYPNPFNSQTKINYTITETGYVSLTIYDVMGREIKTFINHEQGPGSYSFALNANDLSSGSYIYSLSSGNKTISRKFILIK